MRPNKGTGRPKDIHNLELVRMLVKHFRNGLGLKEAAMMCGLAHSQVHLWMKKGKNGEPGYHDFWLRANRAKARFRNQMLQMLITDKNWQTKAWILERLYHQRYGRKQNTIIVKSEEPPKTLAEIVTKIRGVQQQFQNRNNTLPPTNGTANGHVPAGLPPVDDEDLLDDLLDDDGIE